MNDSLPHPLASTDPANLPHSVDNSPNTSTVVHPNTNVEPQPAPQLDESCHTDPLDDEFRYYSTIILCLLPTITNEEHRSTVVAWYVRLNGPEFEIPQLKIKRNRFLMMISMCIQCDNLPGSPFVKRPDVDNLPDPLTVEHAEPSATAAWERDKQWTEYMEDQSLLDPNVKCAIHHPNPCPADEINSSIGATLDRQFQFFLHLAKPLICQLPNALHRQKAAGWLQRLCSDGTGMCAITKGIRNDYMMLLVGYLSSGLLTGPFQQYAPNTLVPLNELEIGEDSRPSNLPNDPTIGRMLSDLPFPPEQGAFAFLSVTADMFENQNP